MLAHIAGVPFEEWLMPFTFSAGAVFLAVRARFGSFHSSGVHRDGRRERTSP